MSIAEYRWAFPRHPRGKRRDVSTVERNPRAFDLTTRTRAVVPTSDRARVEILRVDPVAQFEDLAPARKLPRGVVP